MIARPIRFMRVDVLLYCDGKCSKAWGVNSRPRKDELYISDDELPNAPIDAEIQRHDGGARMTRAFLLWRRKQDDALTVHICASMAACRYEHELIPIPETYRVVNDFVIAKDAILDALDKFRAHEEAIRETSA